MKKVMTIIGVSVLALSNSVLAENFVGVSAGAATYPSFVGSDTTLIANTVAAANPNTSISASGVQDKSGVGTKIYGGSWVNENMGFEVGYANLGKPTETITTTGVATTWKADAAITAFFASTLGQIKVSGSSRAFGKLGIYSSNVDQKFSVSGPGGLAASNATTNGSGALFGIGYETKITSDIGLRTEYEMFSSVKIAGDTASVGLLSIGLTKGF